MGSCADTKGRQVLNEHLANAVVSFYSGKCEDFNLGYIVERAEAAIEAAIREESSSEQWIYLRIAVEPSFSNTVIPFSIVPAIVEIKRRAPIGGWWWLKKRDPLGPAIRLRVAVPLCCARETERELSTLLIQMGHEVKTLRYEPEVPLFGGAAGIKIAHELFCSDSEFLSSWARCNDRPREPIIPAGLSIALMIYLARATGLDLFECWDLFDRISDKRKISDAEGSCRHRCSDIAIRVIDAGPEAVFAVFRGEQAKLLHGYRIRLEQSGDRLSRAYFHGDLDCGLREWLVPAVLFHWNRTGIPAVAHAWLSRAVADEFRRLARKGTTRDRG
jgi:thiopeptide-type bacteriocin biosynthesis protein